MGSDPSSELRVLNGNLRTEEFELWKRDPVECIRELISNPAFISCTKYAPEELFADVFGEDPIYSEMWTAEWWRAIQV